MKIQLICMGGLKERFLRDAQAEYVKRLGGCCQLSVIELEPVTLPKGASQAQIDAALDTEGKKILSKLAKGYTVALCIEGKQCSSQTLAQKLESLPVNGVSCVNFIIGSSYGLAPAVKQAADWRLSLSEMTFPHQLFRIMLLEQIYRAYDIMGANRYDK